MLTFEEINKNFKNAVKQIAEQQSAENVSKSFEFLKKSFAGVKQSIKNNYEACNK